MMNLWLALPLVLSLAGCSFQPATRAQDMADAKADVISSSTLPTSTTAAQDSENGYITFVVNVHDWVNIEDSADTLIRLVDIFEKYGVKGDFYFTAPVVERYVAERPDVIARLKASDMTISYHIRPPHPAYTGFESKLLTLSDEELYQTLLDYETYGLDLATGELDRSRPGGYSYVSEVFSTKPVVASSPSQNRRIKKNLEKIFSSLGARMTVLYHESGTDIEVPFEYSSGLLIRPSDFSITRVPGGQNFWWNFMTGKRAMDYDPLKLLQDQLSGWNAERPPFITSLIHENNFYRSGAESWKPIYLSGDDYSIPLDLPYDLNAPDISKVRPEKEQEAIWQAYERLVTYSAQNLKVVTSADLVEMAK